MSEQLNLSEQLEFQRRRADKWVAVAEKYGTALRDLIDAIPEETLKADPPLESWVRIAEQALAGGMQGAGK